MGRDAEQAHQVQRVLNLEASSRIRSWRSVGIVSPLGRKAVLNVLVPMAGWAVSTAVHRLISKCGLAGQRWWRSRIHAEAQR